MPDWPTFVLFLIAAFLLLITPGPAVLYIVARSIDQGRLAGIVSVLGIAVGALVHVAAAALGLSALLVSSALTFTVVKYLGAIYLIYLGIRKLLSREEVQHSAKTAPRRLARIFFDGILVNLLNPKTALFFFAFLPQFIDPGRGLVAAQVLLLGLIFVGMAIISDGLYALLAGTLGKWLKGNLQFLRGQRYFAGFVYITLGITAALADTGRK